MTVLGDDFHAFSPAAIDRGGGHEADRNDPLVSEGPTRGADL